MCLCFLFSHLFQGQLQDHGPFRSLSRLWEHNAHLAVFMNYVISNSDPSSLVWNYVSFNSILLYCIFFYVLTFLHFFKILCACDVDVWCNALAYYDWKTICQHGLKSQPLLLPLPVELPHHCWGREFLWAACMYLPTGRQFTFSFSERKWVIMNIHVINALKGFHDGTAWWVP